MLKCFLVLMLCVGYLADVQGMNPDEMWKEYLTENTPLDILLTKGANVNHRNQDGRTPLHRLVAYSSDSGRVIALIKAGADVNSKDNNWTTPLHLAAWYESPDVVRVLIDKGADVNAKTKEHSPPKYDTDGFTPLHEAAFVCNIPIMKMLINAGARLNEQSSTKGSPLGAAFYILRFSTGKKKAQKAIKFLIQAGAPVVLDEINEQILHQEDKDWLVSEGVLIKLGEGKDARYELDIQGIQKLQKNIHVTSGSETSRKITSDSETPLQKKLRELTSKLETLKNNLGTLKTKLRDLKQRLSR